MALEIVFSVIVALGIVVAALFLLKKPIAASIAEAAARAAEERSRQVFQEERNRLGEQFQAKESVLDEKIKSGKDTISHNRDNIQVMVKMIKEELEQNRQELKKTERDRVSEFNTLKTVVAEHKAVTANLKESTDDLKNILSNNQRRGKYGEEAAENLLNSVGFVKGQNYFTNKSQDTTSTRPDFTILLPDKTKINIDAKFPLQALIKYQEAKEKDDKDRHLRQFSADVKSKIKEVTSRDYINPEEGTVDFVILFVPNEMIFSFIYDKLSDVWQDALQKKVIMAGPFGFSAITRMVYQSYRNFARQENIHNIIKLIEGFTDEWEKYNVEVDKLGVRLESTSKQFNQVAVTRSKKLSRIMDQIKGEEVLPEPTTPKLLDQ